MVSASTPRKKRLLGRQVLTPSVAGEAGACPPVRKGLTRRSQRTTEGHEVRTGRIKSAAADRRYRAGQRPFSLMEAIPRPIVGRGGPPRRYVSVALRGPPRSPCEALSIGRTRTGLACEGPVSTASFIRAKKKLRRLRSAVAMHPHQAAIVRLPPSGGPIRRPHQAAIVRRFTNADQRWRRISLRAFPSVVM